MKRFIFMALSGLIIFGLERLVASGHELTVALRIAAGFLCLFFFPGLCLAEILLKKDEADFADRIAFAFPLSLALFVLPALAFFVFETQLEKIFLTLMGLAVAVWLVALAKNFSSPAASRGKPGTGRWIALALIVCSGVLAWLAGASRGPEQDWDLYNYIGMVRKFLLWDQAGIHHYFYADAPPDPIHSYNLHALVWAIIAKKNRVDPIPLYIHSAFLTVPLCFFGFFSMARRALGDRAGFLAFAFYFFFQVIYSGLYFVGNSTFYPDDSIWLLCLPALLSLAFLYLEKSGWRLLLLSSLSALAVSVVHPLWGLAFYMVAAFFLAAETVRSNGIFSILRQNLKSGMAQTATILLAAVLVIVPFLLTALYMIIKTNEDPKQWFTPIFPDFALDRLWIYALVFVGAPIIIFMVNVNLSQSITQLKASKFWQSRYFQRTLLLILVSLIVAAPYAYLRSRTIVNTQWQSFGRNPYRGLITPALFMLNPFKRSFTDPNMTFHPIFWLGLILSPWLFRFGKKEPRPLALAGFYSLAGVVLWALHPVLATGFAKFFSLGYLRRILRLPALLSFLSIGAFLEVIASRAKIKTAYAFAAGIILAGAFSFALIPVPTEPIYHDLLKRMVNLTRPQNRDTLMADDTPFQFLGHHKYFEKGDVIFSDLYTSFRAPAYLPVYVAVQDKPGVGVADQDQRRLEEIEFFVPSTTIERMSEMLKQRKAKWVIINRNPQYEFYDYPLGHPEIIRKLAAEPKLFEEIFDRGDWAIFRFRPAPCRRCGE